MSDPIVIAGAGLAGSLLAAQLALAGQPIRLFEKRADSRLEAVAAGRSINLALAERGWEGLRRAGAVDLVRRFALPMRGRMVHDREGRTTLQPYGVRSDEVIYSVHRGELNRCLLDVAAAAGATLRFNAPLTDVDFDARIAMFGGERVWFRVLIGADGAGSALRHAMNSADPLGDRTDFLDHGYKELRIPDRDGKFALDPEALHIWPRGGYMLIALPNPDRSFTATLFLANGPVDGGASFAAIQDVSAARDFFAAEFADALANIPDFDAQWLSHPVGLLGTLHSPRWHHQDRALLIGDAAHAIVPFHGQGMNCAFEDCVALIDSIAGQSPDAIDWQAVFERFDRERRPNAEAIAAMALENYIEMRDSVADRDYQLRRALELEIARRLPAYRPRYAQVMFTSIPYAQAQANGARQAQLMRALTAGKQRIEEIDIDAAVEAAAALAIR
jgi:kynurenine 3-monooxygenase